MPGLLSRRRYYKWSLQARSFLFRRERPRLPFTARIIYELSLQARSLSLQGWGLIDLLLRASNEGLLRPRVARAQKIIRLHPLPPPLPKYFVGVWHQPVHQIQWTYI